MPSFSVLVFVFLNLQTHTLSENNFSKPGINPQPTVGMPGSIIPLYVYKTIPLHVY